MLGLLFSMEIFHLCTNILDLPRLLSVVSQIAFIVTIILDKLIFTIIFITSVHVGLHVVLHVYGISSDQTSRPYIFIDPNCGQIWIQPVNKPVIWLFIDATLHLFPDIFNEKYSLPLNEIGFSVPTFPCKQSPQKQEKSYICGIVQLTFTVTGTLAPAWHHFIRVSRHMYVSATSCSSQVNINSLS